MSIEIFDAHGDVAATVDPTSKALRGSIYGTDGLPEDQAYRGSYVVGVSIIPTTLTVNTVYFAIQNPGPYIAALRRFEYVMGFTGTAALSTSYFTMTRIPQRGFYTGGTALTAVKKNNRTMPHSLIDVRVAPGGLTNQSGAGLETAWGVLGVTNQLVCDIEGDFDFGAAANETDSAKLQLHPGDSLILAAGSAIVNGAYLIGSFSWDELARVVPHGGYL
jgi:hypothetical protein